jgi:hypothetical protein
MDSLNINKLHILITTTTAFWFTGFRAHASYHRDKTEQQDVIAVFIFNVPELSPEKLLQYWMLLHIPITTALRNTGVL